MTGKATKPDGGFVFIPAMALISAWWAYKRRIIELGDLRVWLASHELVAERCALQKGRVPAFRIEELVTLLRVRDNVRIERAVRRLQRVGLLTWSRSKISFVKSPADIRVASNDLVATIESVTNHRRKVPVPRRMLRFLATTRKPAVIATLMGHFLRCLYYRDRACSPSGLCKASLIASVFEVDIRSVKAARKQLEGQGLLIRHQTDQWRMNRWGPSVEVNLTWSAPSLVKRRKSPPRPADFSTVSPPPESNRELSSKEKTRNADAPHRSGACMRREPDSVSLRDVRNEHLRDGRTLRVLYQQAVGEGLISASESDELRFFAAAEHARVRSSTNPPGLFVAVIRRGLWTYITQREEDAARKRIQGLESPDRGEPPADLRSRGPNDGRITTSDVVERTQIRDTVSRSLQWLTSLARSSGQAAAGLALVPSRPGSVAAHPNAPAPPRCLPPPIPEGAARGRPARVSESGTYRYAPSRTAKPREKTRISEKP